MVSGTPHKAYYNFTLTPSMCDLCVLLSVLYFSFARLEINNHIRHLHVPPYECKYFIADNTRFILAF